MEEMFASSSMILYFAIIFRTQGNASPARLMGIAVAPGYFKKFADQFHQLRLSLRISRPLFSFCWPAPYSRRA